jgi:hypothetical protein
LGKPIKKLNLLEAMRNATQILPAHTPTTAPIAETNGAAPAAPAKPQTLLIH